MESIRDSDSASIDCAVSFDDTLLSVNFEDPAESNFALDGKLGLADYEGRASHQLQDDHDDATVWR